MSQNDKISSKLKIARAKERGLLLKRKPATQVLFFSVSQYAESDSRLVNKTNLF